MLKNQFFSLKRWFPLGGFLACMAIVQPAAGQSVSIPLNDLSSFTDPGDNWQVVGDLKADLAKDNKFTTSKGSGILLNQPARRKQSKDLFTDFEHGDMDLELEFMMAKGSNSGIYLQGRYELQLHDSWGTTQATAAHNGGIYERWDESQPQGRKGYEGYAPRQNVSRAPGLWQHLKLSFQAPRFDANGQKIENARIVRAELNGVTIHENVELQGPTRGATSQEEQPEGPLRIQGDHGAVAFRNIRVHQYDKPRPELKNLRYAVYAGRYEQEPAYDELPPETEGPSVILTSDLSPRSNQYLIRYTGTLEVKEAGEYTFKLDVAGGSGLVRINQQEIIPLSRWSTEGKVDLPAGEVPFEMLYSRFEDWVEPGMGLSVAGPGIREYLISDGNTYQRDQVDPILIEAQENTVLRSFMDLPSPDGRSRGVRVTHAVSVGSPEQLHYTYDMDNGTIVQLWRGGFLNATPMWHDRGDGSSRPVGSVQPIAAQELTVAKLSSPEAAWLQDTTGTSYRPKGYVLDEQGRPTFLYRLYGAAVEDNIRVLEGGKGLRRELRLERPAEGLYARLAEGDSVEEISKGLYLIDGKAYYLQLDDAGGAKPLVRNISGRQELIIPLREKLSYSILF